MPALMVAKIKLKTFLPLEAPRPPSLLLPIPHSRKRCHFPPCKQLRMRRKMRAHTVCFRLVVHRRILIFVHVASTDSSQNGSQTRRIRHKVTVAEIDEETGEELSPNTQNSVLQDGASSCDGGSGESEVSEPESDNSGSTRKRAKRKKSRSKSKMRKRQKTTAQDSDIEVVIMDIESTLLSVRRDKSKDVDFFFTPIYTDGGKRMRDCRKCRSVQASSLLVDLSSHFIVLLAMERSVSRSLMRLQH